MSDGQNRKWRLIGRLALIASAVPILYVASYLTLGQHETGENWGPRYTYHDRNFSFDPWVNIPLAKLECMLRGPNVQVVLDGSPGRDGSILYDFWSSKPKFGRHDPRWDGDAAKESADRIVAPND
jgi:hypothetical protein